MANNYLFWILVWKVRSLRLNHSNLHFLLLRRSSISIYNNFATYPVLTILLFFLNLDTAATIITQRTKIPLWIIIISIYYWIRPNSIIIELSKNVLLFDARNLLKIVVFFTATFRKYFFFLLELNKCLSVEAVLKKISRKLFYIRLDMFNYEYHIKLLAQILNIISLIIRFQVFMKNRPSQ